MRGGNNHGGHGIPLPTSQQEHVFKNKSSGDMYYVWDNFVTFTGYDMFFNATLDKGPSFERESNT